MKKILISACVLLATASYSQFGGLNKIKDKAKGDSKTEQKSGASDAKSSSGSESSQNQSSSGTPENKSSSEAPKKQTQRPLYTVNDFSSEVHKKNVNKIVFSATADGVAFGKEKEASFINSYKLGDPLFFRAYTENSIANYAILNGKNTFHLIWKFNIYLDGVKIGFFNSVKQEDQEAKEKWTTFKAALVSNNLNEYGPTASEFSSIIALNYDKFTTGKHVLKLELYPVSETSDKPDMPVVSTAELNIDVPAKLVNTSLCFLDKPVKSDPAMEADILKIAQKIAEPGVKINKVILMQKNWTEIRSETTGLIYRKEMKAVLFGTKENGKTCFYQDLIYSQRMFPQKGEDPTYIKEFVNMMPTPCACK